MQQGLLIDFASFPLKFIDLLNQCFSEQESDNPRYEKLQTATSHLFQALCLLLVHKVHFFGRFLLHLSCQSPVLEGLVSFSVVETNAFKHLNHLSLRLAQGSDKDVKDYLAVCLSSLKVTHSNP